jgi:hypothetical protein
MNLYQEIQKCIYRKGGSNTEGGITEKYSGIKLSSTIAHK